MFIVCIFKIASTLADLMPQILQKILSFKLPYNVLGLQSKIKSSEKYIYPLKSCFTYMQFIFTCKQVGKKKKKKPYQS